MSPSSPSHRRRRRGARRPTWAGLRRSRAAWLALGLLGALALLAVARMSAVRQDLNAARTALASARSAMSSHDVDASASALDRADAAAGRAVRVTDGFPLSALRPLPLVGSPVKALSAGARAGREAVAAGRILGDAAASFPTSGTAAGVDGHDLTQVHTAVARSGEAIGRADVHLAAAERTLAGPASSKLPPVSSAARDLLATVGDARRQLGSAERGLRLLSDLTAPGTDARILLLSQDSMELRPTGGYVGSFGVLHFSHGTVALDRYESFEALPDADPPLPAPADLAAALNRPWDLSNSTWWPDFPTSARSAAELFRRQGGGDVAGVVAVTENVMARLVGVFGPVKLPGYAVPVTEEGFAKRVLYEVELKRPLDVPRKRFLTELADEVFARLFHLPPAQLPVVVDALGRAAGAGDLQVWFKDPSRQSELAGTTLSGALPEPSGDFLLLAEANMTASKANAGLVRDVHYDVKAGDGGRPVAELRIDYRNDAPRSEVNPYYNGFLRVYVPWGSELDPGSEGYTEAAPDGPYTVIGVHVLVPADGGRKTLTLTYRLPASVALGGSYHLTWLRQPGTPADHLAASVGGRTFEADPAQRRLSVSADLRH